MSALVVRVHRAPLPAAASRALLTRPVATLLFSFCRARSTRRADIRVDELLPLLREALAGARPAAPRALSSLRVTSRRNQPDVLCRPPAPELDAAKVAAALAHSTVVAAAYVTDSGGEGASAGSSPSDNTAPRERSSSPPALGGWLSLLPRAPQRRLVGFARAAGDATLVALVADVAVAPQHRKTGVGARLVAAVLDELRALGVADVGALSSDAMRPFFRSVSTLCWLQLTIG